MVLQSDAGQGDVRAAPASMADIERCTVSYLLHDRLYAWIVRIGLLAQMRAG
jgi:hypothetical protein